MGKGTKLYRFVCKTGSWTVKIPPRNRMHQHSPYWDRKSKIFLFHSGEGTFPPHALPPSALSAPQCSRLRRSISASAPAAPRPPPTGLCSSKLTLKSPAKSCFWDPRFVGGRDTPDFGHAFSNCTYFRACGRFLLSSIQRGRRLDGEKRRRKKERKKESAVKYKSADMYVGRPNKGGPITV